MHSPRGHALARRWRISRPRPLSPKASIASSPTRKPTNTNWTAWPAEWGYWRQSEVVSESTSRPATLEDLKALLRSLNAHGVDYLLIGGYALAAHGYQRATTDIDIVFPATAAAGNLVKEALMILPDQAA